MEQIKQFQVWLSRRWILVFFLLSALLLWTLQTWMQRPQASIVHTLGSSNHRVEVVWLTLDDIFNPITTAVKGTAYTMPLTQDNLIAINIESGARIWETKLQFQQRDARGLLANEDTVFLVTGIGVDSYRASTGELKWSTILGDGHVSVVSQLDSDLVRIYYGDTLFEIDMETGNIVSTRPKNDIVWLSNNIVLRETPTHQLVGVNVQTNELLWTNDNVPYVREDYKPQMIGEDHLIIGFVKGVCMLNLQTGEYVWCRPDINLTKLAVDSDSRLGFAIRDDLVLLTIDLQTGNVLGETIFLSSKPIDEQIGFLSSITFSNGMLVVSFSDSGQTFGLRFKNIK